MPQLWTPDDLRFADIRAAHLEPAEQIAEDLLAAAAQPGSRLRDVAVSEARLHAADLLIAADDRDQAATIARQVLQDVRGGMDEFAATCTLARAGDRDAVRAFTAPVLGALRDRPSEAVIMSGVKLALHLADEGEFDLAAQVADDAVAACARWKAEPGRHADRNGTVGKATELARQTVLAVQQDLRDLAAGLRADEPGMQPSALPPWPALFGSYLLWWPQAEYQRVVRQVPDVRSVLGATWRDHTATVETTMAALAPAGSASLSAHAAAYCLAAGDFDYFCGYLRLTGADPRQATTMTGFTARITCIAQEVGGVRQPSPWPPAPRSRCWCGSGTRYERCCGRHG